MSLFCSICIGQSIGWPSFIDGLRIRYRKLYWCGSDTGGDQGNRGSRGYI